jgi:hypothetical protein
VQLQLMMFVVASVLAGPSWGAVFSCDEAGLDAAIAVAHGGDPGPHRLNCTPGDEIPFTGGRTIRADIVLDAQGAMARCEGDAPPRGPRCSVAFTLSCPSRICDERPTIELRNLTIPAPMLMRGGFGDGVSVGRADATLRNVLTAGGGAGDLRSRSSGIRLGSLDQGTLHLIESSVSGWAVGVSIGNGSSKIERSLITNNRVGLELGLEATGQLVDSTVSGNGLPDTFNFFSGVSNAGMLTIVNSTLAGNEGLDYSGLVPIECGGGFALLVSAGHATIANSVVEGECGGIGPPPVPLPPDCAPPPPGTVTSNGGNVESPDDTCRFTDPTDWVNVSAEELAIGPLQDNGGPTDTHALLEGSVAIDQGVLGNCTPTDQRGVARPQGAGCDAGAYEAEVVEVVIDIKPGSDLNPLNPMSRGVVPVAILGSESFDVAEVDVTTLAFSPGGAPLAHRNGPHPKDANHDRVKDLLAHFRMEESGIAFGDTEACVTGELLDGTPFEGCDAIVTVGACGLGFELALLLPVLMWLRRRRDFLRAAPHREPVRIDC